MSLSRFFLLYLPSRTQDSLKAASGLYRGRQRELLEKEPLNLVLRRRKDPPQASTVGAEALRPLTSLAGGRQGLIGWGSTSLITFLLSVLPSSPKAGFLARSLQEIWVCKGPTFWLEDSKREPQGGRRYKEMVLSGAHGEVTLRVAQNSVVCAAAENSLSPGCADPRVSGSAFPLMCHSVSSAEHAVLSLAERAAFWHLEDPHERHWWLFHPLPTCVPLRISFHPPQRLRPESRDPRPTNSENKPTLMERWEGLPPG